MEIKEKKELTLRNYQVEPSAEALKYDIAVLAMAPNGGKTEISIDVLCNFLKLYPNKRALVLTHSTNVLKKNYMDRLNGFNLPFKYSDKFIYVEAEKN